MGRKSGRNGAPAPQSRVSLSESKPRDQFSLLELRTEFLAGCFSGFAVDLSALECALAHFVCARCESREKNCAQLVDRCAVADKEDDCADVFATGTNGP
jgi:hypothetical protein